MTLDEIRQGLTQGGYYSAREDDGLLIIRDSEIGSEYVLEDFESSVQIRQAVCLDCHELSEEDLGKTYVLCSMMNERFSGCKNYVDQWGALITAADILGPQIATELIETVLNQVEFVSQAMQSLNETMRSEQRPVTSKEIDDALEVPSLQ
jgi:hypothetical protein